ncbi:MAG: hypothetical protein ABR913_03375 [Sedimentisphaerales bacterium]|jgi:hypothetical protein
MASMRVMRNLVYLMIVLVVSTRAMGYTMQGLDIVVDYWAGAGSNETVVVIDWNQTNGPYETSSHAWGFRWDGTAYLSDALAAIDAAGALNITTLYGGDFVGDAFYCNPSIDSDNHTSVGYSGWWWVGDTINGGVTWDATAAGLTSEILTSGKIEGLNSVTSYDEWLAGGDTLTIPTPEPCTLTILTIGGLFLRRRKNV